MRLYHRLTATAAAVGMIAFGGLAFSQPAEAQTLHMRAATEVAAGGDVHVLLKEFKQAVESESDGAVTVEIFSGGSLGTQRQLQEQVQLGTIEAVGTASDIVEMAGEFGIFDLPFLFNDRQHAYRAMDGELGERLNELLIERKDVRVLAFGELGFRHITNKVRPIESPEDLKGLKIRTPSSELRIAAFKALGAAPTPIPYSELYSALQQGVVDGQENPLTTVAEKSLWEVQDYISKTYHVFTPAYILVSETWWQKLTDEQQAWLAEAGEAAAQAQRQALAGKVEELAAQAKENGMKINSPDLTPFVEKTRSVWRTYSDEYGDEMIDLAESAR